ncbi:MAG: hypothetical protein U1D35_12315, partial [Paracoccaceae bacterium]|nr:hypothetical protein [Paracoccaceae bacterium]
VGVTTPPRVVLDFKKDVFGLGADRRSFAGMISFTRASEATGIGPGGAPITYGVNEPVYDWSTGRRGLLLRPAAGARAADVARLTLGDWWTGAAGGLEVRGRVLAAPGGFDRVMELHDGTTTNRVSVLFNASLGQLVFGVYVANVAQAVLVGPATAYAPGVDFDLKGRYGPNDFSFQRDTAAVLTDTLGTVPPALTTLQLAASVGGSNPAAVLFTRLVVF